MEESRIKVVCQSSVLHHDTDHYGLFENHVPIKSITVMVQKEVAMRMQAGPGTKDYGALSLAVQYYAEPYLAANVPPNCFMPRPNVAVR